MKPDNHFRRFRSVALILTPILLASCASLGASGPSSRSIKTAGDKNHAILVVDLTDEMARQIVRTRLHKSFVQTFGNTARSGQIVGPGDVLDVAILEAPPAALFGSSAIDSRLPTGAEVARNANIPQQMVDSSGQISVPFVGSINVVGRTPSSIAQTIASRLAGKAHDPQVIVRIAENNAADVTVIGEVTSSRRVPLTPKGERLLDALASAGGVKQPINKITIQVARDGVVASESLASIIHNPAENIGLRANDVVTALYQPYSFQALGAFGINASMEFEATGLSLAQALGRLGGLQDNRADVKGVFIFRLEDPAALGSLVTPSTRLTPDGRVPVIYRVNMSDPATFFIAQGFPIEDKDVIYVSNAPLIDIQKFLTVISSTAFSIVSVGNAAR